MSQSPVQKRAPLEWSVAMRPVAGEAVSGDMHLVKLFDQGALMAVVDGVGHGGEATAAASVAIGILEKHFSEPVISLVNRCHAALTATRGVVMTVAALNTREGTITWLGVGNVEGTLLRADAKASHPVESVLQRSGLVGYQLPALQASVMPVMPGDLLIFATDGIRNDFLRSVNRNESPKQLASRILHQHFKGSDDALVLVARYSGRPHE